MKEAKLKNDLWVTAIKFLTAKLPNSVAVTASTPKPPWEDLAYVVEAVCTPLAPSSAVVVVSSPETVPSTRAVEPEDIT